MSNKQNTEIKRDFFITNINGIYRTHQKSPLGDNWVHPEEKRRKEDSFIYILGGEAMLYVGDFEFHVKPNDIIHRPAHLNYKSHGLKGPFYYFNLTFDADEKSSVLDTVIHDENQYFLKKFETIFTKWQRKERQYLLECKALVYSLAAELFNERDYIKHPNKHREIISRANSYIENNIANPTLSINEILGFLNISDTYFRQIFKEYHGISPLKYITDLRINKAKDYLENSDMNITRIAMATGFSNVYYFSNIFKSNVGLSPMKYKKKQKGI